jgi:hypothetical protein
MSTGLPISATDARSQPSQDSSLGLGREWGRFIKSHRRPHAESTSRLRSGMKDPGEAGLQRRLSLSAHCHIFFDVAINISVVLSRSERDWICLRNVGKETASRNLRQLLRSTQCVQPEGGCQATDDSLSFVEDLYAGNEVGYRQGEFRRDVWHSKLRVPGVRRNHGWSRQRVQVPGRVSEGLASALGADRCVWGQSANPEGNQPI